MNEAIIFHSASAGSFRQTKGKCFEEFEFSTTPPDICTNADDAEIIKSKTSIIFKLFKLEIVVFVAESMKNFVDVIAQIKFKKTVSFKNLFIFEFRTLKWRWNSTKTKQKLLMLIIIKTMKKKQ